MLLLLVLVVNVLIAGGLAYVVISGQQKAAAPAKAGEDHEAAAEGHQGGEEEPAEEESDGHKKGAKFGPIVEIGVFVANLTAAGGGSRYAKVGLFVEAANEDAKAKVEAAVVPIRNEALMYLSGLNADQAIGQEKIRVLQEELQKRVVALLGKGTIKRLYFSEFVVQ